MQHRFRQAHRRIWLVLAVALPLALLMLMTLRQTQPLDRAAELLAPPSEVSGEVAE